MSLKEIEEVIKSFEGIIDQVPPYYSAKKYMGKPLYEWAREGKFIELQPKRVTIYSIEIMKISLPIIQVKVLSSSGMYVRSLARDIGEKAQNKRQESWWNSKIFEKNKVWNLHRKKMLYLQRL